MHYLEEIAIMHVNSIDTSTDSDGTLQSFA